jgi:hypothetical protein
LVSFAATFEPTQDIGIDSDGDALHPRAVELPNHCVRRHPRISGMSDRSILLSGGFPSS